MFLNHIKRFFNRPPRAGGRKEVPMPMPDVQPPPAPAPAAPAPKAPDDLSGPLSTLIDAMRQLAESQKTLTEAVKGPGKKDPEPGTPNPSGDISGEPIGGQRPSAVVDYSRMSPVQQITLGLRDSRNNAPSAGAD
jgi:hypothetical protein